MEGYRGRRSVAILAQVLTKLSVAPVLWSQGNKTIITNASSIRTMTTSFAYDRDMVAAAGSISPTALNATDKPVPDDSPRGSAAAARQRFQDSPAELAQDFAFFRQQQDEDITVHAHDASALHQPSADVMRTKAAQDASTAAAADGTPQRVQTKRPEDDPWFRIDTPAGMQTKMNNDAARMEQMQNQIRDLEQMIK